MLFRGSAVSIMLVLMTKFYLSWVFLGKQLVVVTKSSLPRLWARFSSSTDKQDLLFKSFVFFSL